VQALVLAGGEGTRLRPLTLTTPKPVLPLAGRPFLSFMLDWLHGHGVDEAILSLGFLSDAVHAVLGDIQSGMRLRYVHEDEPLGTAGPIRLAADEGILADRFLVLNGDVLTDMDLTAEIEQHARTGAAGTLALIEVDDVSSYGVVSTDDEGKVLEFREKAPGPAPTNRINAGAYVIEKSVVDLIPAGRAVSFEREVFPEMVGRGLYGWAADGYWIDIGTPERYLEATWDLLAGRVESTLPERDETGSLLYEGSVTSGAHIGPQAVVGPHCNVGADTAIEQSVLYDRVVIRSDSVVRQSIIGSGARIGAGVRMQDAVIGDGAVVADHAVLEPGARVDPGAVAPDPQGAPTAASNPDDST
jgi:mannose-1-phosphate guanylyltransferase